MKTVLAVENLSIYFKTKENVLPIVQDISFQLLSGKLLALLGESGSGKTMTALSIMRLLSDKASYAEESKIFLKGQDLLTLPESKMQKIRGGKIAMIFQDPASFLNPIMTISEQIQEPLALHQSLRGKASREEVYRLLEAVSIQDVQRVSSAYPHQLSGGTKQRVMIAMALSGKPELLIADEPSSALDVTTQVQIVQLLKRLQIEYGMSILFITHDLLLARLIADSVVILKAGKVVEQGITHCILNNPQQTYTRQLIDAVPRCLKNSVAIENETVLSVENLSIYFPTPKKLFSRTQPVVKAVDGLSFSIQEGETLAFVGETGSGKTSVGKAILSLINPYQGEINILGHSLRGLKGAKLRQKRSHFQMIFQDSASALDPRFTVKQILKEALWAQKIGIKSNEHPERIACLLEQVGLSSKYLTRYPHELSGGEQQRVCIARALAVGPELLVCDEPTSSLDVSVQAQIIDLLVHLQNELDIAYLFITHNMQLVKTIAHRVAVMYGGKIVEIGPVDEVLNSPRHWYTQRLLDAIPRW